jgi:hypothetical protein
VNMGQIIRFIKQSKGVFLREEQMLKKNNLKKVYFVIVDIKFTTLQVQNFHLYASSQEFYYSNSE